MEYRLEQGEKGFMQVNDQERLEKLLEQVKKDKQKYAEHFAKNPEEKKHFSDFLIGYCEMEAETGDFHLESGVIPFPGIEEWNRRMKEREEWESEV